MLPALEWLKDMASSGGVLVVGPGVLDPVRVAERALALSRRVEVILAASPERHAKQLAEMQRSSLLGSAVPCVSLGEPEALALAIAEAAARVERRQRYRAVATRADAKLQVLPGAGVRSGVGPVRGAGDGAEANPAAQLGAGARGGEPAGARVRGPRARFVRRRRWALWGRGRRRRRALKVRLGALRRAVSRLVESHPRAGGAHRDEL